MGLEVVNLVTLCKLRFCDYACVNTSLALIIYTHRVDVSVRYYVPGLHKKRIIIIICLKRFKNRYCVHCY